MSLQPKPAPGCPHPRGRLYPTRSGCLMKSGIHNSSSASISSRVCTSQNGPRGVKKSARTPHAEQSRMTSSIPCYRQSDTRIFSNRIPCETIKNRHPLIRGECRLHEGPFAPPK